jgi:hypothetical protein
MAIGISTLIGFGILVIRFDMLVFIGLESLTRSCWIAKSKIFLYPCVFFFLAPLRLRAFALNLQRLAA